MKGSYLFTNGKNAGYYLQIAYPEYPAEIFKPSYFSNKGKKSSQRLINRLNNLKLTICRWLFVQLSKLLPKGTKLIEDYLHPLCYWEGNKAMQFDIWVPDYNLAIEYQGKIFQVYLTHVTGEHHYQDIPGLGIGGTLSINKTRDNVKQNIAKELNINFLAIPYW